MCGADLSDLPESADDEKERKSEKKPDGKDCKGEI